MAHGKKEMLNKLKLLLETPKTKNFDLELLKMCNYYVCQHVKPYKDRIYNLTKKIIEENN